MRFKFTQTGSGGKAEKKDRSELWLAILTSLIAPILVLVFTYRLTGKLDELLKERERDLKERQFHADNIRQMQPLLTDLEDVNVKREKAHASAVAMSAYGPDAVPLLLHALTEDTPFGGDAAQDALLALDKDDVASACSRLGEILSLRWIHANVNLGERSLHDVLPELRYIEGLTGYLRYRILGGDAEMASSATQALGSYPLPSEDDPNPLPGAVALQMRGFLDLLASKQSAESLMLAQKEFAEAYRIAPFSAEAGNLELITRAAVSYLPGHQPLGSKIFAADLLHASALDPANPEPRTNLAVLYRYSEQPEIVAAVPPDQRLTSADDLEKIKTIAIPKQQDVVADRPPTDWPLKPIV